MLNRQKLTPEETRARIVAVAEEQFRRIGYAKTTVADIAAALGMSPANVYRFFPSKSAINNAICQTFMAACEATMKEALAAPGTVGERLRSAFLTLHRFNKQAFTDEHRLYDMVSVAMEENWPAIKQHMRTVECSLAELIERGVASGEFRAVEPQDTAKTLIAMYVGVVHPALIAQCADEDLEGQTQRITDLVLHALKAPEK